MQERSALGRAMAMVRDLRDRCPWDRAQTRETLRPYLIEEVHELDHAIGEGEVTAIRSEVSDLLLHLAWQLVLAEENAEFTPDEAAALLETKMRRRHPHLFDLGPKESWESIKRREHSTGLLDGLAPSLPDLLMAHRLQDRAAAVGFDWPDLDGPIAKVREELGEVEHELARDDYQRSHLEHEVGDLLFAVVNLARKANVSPGPALERANQRFRERFGAMERRAAETGKPLHELSLAEMDQLWDEAKRNAIKKGNP